MPIYTYQCSICDSITEAFRTIAHRKDGPECGCGHETLLKITPTQLAPVLGGGDFQGYMCPVTDKWVTSRKARREIMAEHNLIEKGDSGRGNQASGLPSR
jgi:putative FmdB family regulatory protein